MAQFNVSFWLEADSLTAAETAVGQWVVTPGTTLVTISGTVASEGEPIDIPDGGTVGDAIEAQRT